MTAFLSTFAGVLLGVTMLVTYAAVLIFIPLQAAIWLEDRGHRLLALAAALLAFCLGLTLAITTAPTLADTAKALIGGVL